MVPYSVFLPGCPKVFTECRSGYCTRRDAPSVVRLEGLVFRILKESLSWLFVIMNGYRKCGLELPIYHQLNWSAGVFHYAFSYSPLRAR